MCAGRGGDIPVKTLRSEDFPTDGNPINATRACPTRDTAKPLPSLAPPVLGGSNNWTKIQFIQHRMKEYQGTKRTAAEVEARKIPTTMMMMMMMMTLHKDE